MVRVAGKGYGTGRVGEGRAHGVPKTELRFVVEGIRGRGLETSLGYREVWIRVLVRCYTECNKELSSSPGKGGSDGSLAGAA